MTEKYLNFTMSSNQTIEDVFTRDEMCQIAYSFRSDYKFLFINLINTIGSFLSLLVIYYLTQSSRMKHIWHVIGWDLKFIVFINLMGYVIGSINTFMLFGYKTILLLFNFPPCTYLWSGRTCYWFNATYGSAFTIAFGMIHFALLFERLYVIFLKPKDKLEGVFGFVLAAFIVISSPIPQTFLTDTTFYTPTRLYCSAMFAKIHPSVMSVTLYMIGIDVLISCGDLILFFYNREQIRRYRSKYPLNFNLERSFELRQMQIAISVIYPFSIVFTLVYGGQLMAYPLIFDYFQRSSYPTQMFINEFMNLLRVYGTLILMSFMLFQDKYLRLLSLRRVGQRQPTNADQHFAEFQRVIA